MQGKRNESESGRAYCNEDGTQTQQARIEEGVQQRPPFFVLFLDAIEEDDDVAHDDSDETCNTQEGHEAKRLLHQGERDECTDATEGDGGKDDKRLHDILELRHEREIDRQNGDTEGDREVGNPHPSHVGRAGSPPAARNRAWPYWKAGNGHCGTPSSREILGGYVVWLPAFNPAPVPRCPLRPSMRVHRHQCALCRFDS
jgi:hypothetical protein